VAGEATADAPARRRTSWNLKSIVQDVAGRPIEDFQDPDRPTHPFLQGKLDPPGHRPAPPPKVEEEPYDPVGTFYPPLVGPTGRAYHGADHEHHAETLARHRPENGGDGHAARAPSPSSRPERLYLHYLLLHMDRLSDSGLRYLLRVVEEEMAHRATPMSVPAPAEAEAHPPAA